MSHASALTTTATTAEPRPVLLLLRSSRKARPTAALINLSTF